MSDEQQALLGAIFDDPMDDEVRWVYADWLEEQGDLARAEFIRLQLESAADPQKPQQARERILLLQFGSQWRPPAMIGVHWGKFRRGWVDEVVPFYWRAFVMNRRQVFEAAPFTHLNLWGNDLHDRQAAELAGWPELSRLSSLDLWSNQIGDVGAQALASSPYLANLTRLNLTRNPISPLGRETLIAHFGRRVFFHAT